jgi:hypothetical protein
VIAYEGNRYSVPARLVGQQLTLKEDFDGTLHLFADSEEVAVHSRLRGRGQFSIVKEHHAPLWKALGGLGEKKRRPVRAANARVSLWQVPLVNVEHRSLGVYAELEGRS